MARSDSLIQRIRTEYEDSGHFGALDYIQSKHMPLMAHCIDQLLVSCANIGFDPYYENTYPRCHVNVPFEF